MEPDGVGVGVTGFTVTTRACVVVPPVPVQVREYVYVPGVVGGVTDVPRLEEGRLTPVHEPLAAQEAVFVEDHVNVELPPLMTDVGVAVKVMTGAGVGVVLMVTVTPWTADPQVRV